MFERGGKKKKIKYLICEDSKFTVYKHKRPCCALKRGALVKCTVTSIYCLPCLLPSVNHSIVLLFFNAKWRKLESCAEYES